MAQQAAFTPRPDFIKRRIRVLNFKQKFMPLVKNQAKELPVLVRNFNNPPSATK